MKIGGQSMVAPQPRPRRPGQAMVEMALVIILMMTLAMGIADLGLYMYRYVQAANCAREAARRAVVRDPAAATPPYCLDTGLTPTVSAGYLTAPVGSEVTAVINTTHQWMAIGTLIPGLGDSAPLRARTSMRMEGQKI